MAQTDTHVAVRPPARSLLAPGPEVRVPDAAVIRTGAARSGTGTTAAIAQAFAHRRLLILTPFAMILGVVLALRVPPSPLGLVVVGLALAIGLSRSGARPVAFRLLAICAAVWLGYGLPSVHGALFGTEMLARPAYGSYQMRVDRVLSTPESGQRLIISGITEGPHTRSLPIRRARIVAKTDLGLAPGDIIAAPVRFYPVPGPVLPNSFDPQLHGYFDGIGAYGTTTDTVTRVTAGDSAAPNRLVDQTRRGIAARIDHTLSQPSAGVARALIIGDQSEVLDETREIMATAGLAHVLAVSGLHLTLVTGLVLVALRGGLALIPALHSHLSIKQLAAAGAVVAGLSYFAISGGSVAAQRATIMLVLLLGAVLVGRRAFTMRNVAIAALVVILTDPASVVRPSFQLSFAAVVALIGVWELVRRSEHRERSGLARVGGYFVGIVATSLVAGAATLLFSVYHFQQTSPLGVLGNLVALPLVGFVVMPAALVGTLLMPFGWDAPFIAIMGWAIDRMIDLATLVAGWSEAIDASPLLTPLSLGLGLAAFAWFAFIEGWWRLIAPALLIPAVVLLGMDRPPDLLIADSTQAIALHGDAGLELVAGRGGFAVEVWRDHFASPISANPDRLSCDSIACVGSGAGAGSFRLAYVLDPAGFFEECGTVDLVVSRRYAPSTCAAPLVIDAGKLAEHGVHWLRWDAMARRFEIRRAIEDRSLPWRAQR
ncbi:ComEC/Rec2 family competence protein [Devosia sp.]|uniref:ComEC/Rec2 family competence protein n=1 Tax=Devosia sp. TaxID=1871048 RepID=UPI003A94A63B